MVFVLAAIRPSEVADKAKERAALVANFIDRWYVLQLISDEPANPAALVTARSL